MKKKNATHAIAWINGASVCVPVARVFNAPDAMLHTKTALVFDIVEPEIQSWPQLVRDGHLDGVSVWAGPSGNWLVRFGSILVPAVVTCRGEVTP